jgi:hypothetical protein
VSAADVVAAIAIAAADADVAAAVVRHSPALLADLLTSPAPAERDACVEVYRGAAGARAAVADGLRAWDAFFADEILEHAPERENGAFRQFVLVWAELTRIADAFTRERLAIVVRGLAVFAQRRRKNDQEMEAMIQFVLAFGGETMRMFVQEIARVILAPGMFVGAAAFAEAVRANAEMPEFAEVLAEGWFEPGRGGANDVESGPTFA